MDEITATMPSPAPTPAVAPARPKKLTIVMFSGELDKALACFMLATTAASMGMEVTIFFTFWGLNVVKPNQGKTAGKGLRKMLNLMNRGGTKRLKLSKFHMMGAGTAMIKGLMTDINMPSLDEMISMAKDMGVKFVACTTSCGLMGIDQGDLRKDLIDSWVGAATYLAEAADAEVNLFI